MELRIVFLLILAGVSNVFATPTYSQSARISLDMKNISLEQVMDEIEDKSEFYFLFNQRQIDVERTVSVDVENTLIDGVLSQLFNGTGVNYLILDRQILLTTDPLVPIIEFTSGKEEPQQLQVTGTITDASTGEPMPGVNVVVLGTNIGTITDIDGSYTLSVPDASVTLQFSFIGYTTQEVALDGRITLNVALASYAAELSEVVVIGYGVQKKVNVLGSVVNISNEELNSSPVAAVSNALAGHLPGAIIKQQSGQPGSDQSQILIRGNATLGNNSPLIVIDGIPDRDLNSLEPGDIESVSVLKDASAAIYGARSANGVILITTKRGMEGAPSLKYNFYQGWESPTSIIKMCDAATYAQLMREVQGYRGVPEESMQFSLEDIEKYKSGNYPWTHPDSDWFGETLKKFTNTSHHNLSVSGGTTSINYYFSLGKVSDNGIYKAKSTTFDRYNLKGALDVKINEYLTIGLDISASEEDRMNPTKSVGSIWGSMMRSKPFIAAIWPNGLPGPDIEYGDQPIVSSSLAGGFDDDKEYRSNNMITANLKVPGVEGLSISGYFAYDMYFRVRKFFEQPVILYDFDVTEYLAAGNTGVEDGSAFLTGSPRGTMPEPRLTDYYYDSRTTTFNLKANYVKTIFDVHNISAFIAMEGSDYQRKGINAYRRYYLSDKLPYLFAGGSEEINNGSSISIDSRLNFFGRLNYNYKETYLLEFTLRRDGSLRFSEEAGRWGTFPSVLAGWRLSNENFWKNNINFINYFKLRASWGQMGNDAVSAFQYLTSYGFGTGIVLGSGKIYESSLVQSSVPNPDITWEVANVYNLGFESSFFNSKLNLTAEAFYERRNKILVTRNASVPEFTGLSLPDENFGIVDSKGFEAVLGYIGGKAEAFSYSISGNLSFARNKIIEYDEPERSVPWQVLTGHPQGALLLYHSIGVFDDEEDVASYPHVSGARPGDIIIEDFNNDGKITSDDRIIFDKTATPEINYALIFSLGYKNFELSGMIQGMGSTWKTIDYDSRMGVDGNYIQYYADGRWTPDNITAEKPRIFQRTEEYWRGSYLTDYSYNNRAFIRMKNLQLSYTLPKNIAQSIWLKNAKLYVSGQNLFLLYNSFVFKEDPEMGRANGYPLIRNIAAGIQVEF